MELPGSKDNRIKISAKAGCCFFGEVGCFGVWREFYIVKAEYSNFWKSENYFKLPTRLKQMNILLYLRKLG